ncbi:hypothetical protein GGS24DRAFT_46525 [Hypoxylon argillaceum]|nr:hypothetical protein GGS24DRAFT_46525 [Hypoxylon argillaceum]
MPPRRTRAASRREESIEPQEGGPVTRHTRSNVKRAEALDPSQSKSTYHLESGIPQRGTRRQIRRRRSLESVATNDFPKSSGEHVSPDPPPTGTTPTMSAQDAAASNPESQNDSYEDGAARLQDILDFDLPKLRRWCEKTFEALSSLTSPEPTAEERKNLNTARKSFRLARRPLAEEGSAYIDLSLSNLPYQDDPDVHATIHKVTSSANLVSILLSLTETDHSKQAGSPFLQELDNVFSTLLGLDPSSESESHDLAFRVRCRRLVELLKEEPNAESLVLASMIFCNHSPDMPEEAMQQLREGPFRNLGDMEQGGDFTSSEIFKKQIGEIIAKLSLAERAKTVELLDRAFPCDELLEDLRTWALYMYMHVNKNPHENKHLPHDQNLRGSGDGAEREGSQGLLPRENDGSEASSDSGSSSEHEYHHLKAVTKEPSFIQDTATLAAVRQSEKADPTRPRTEPPSNQQSVKRKMTESQIKDAILQLDAADILEPSIPGVEDASETIPRGTRVSYSTSPSRSSTISRELRVAGKRVRQEDEDYVDDSDDDFEVNEQLIDESRRVQYEEPNVTKRSRLLGNSGIVAGRSLSPNGTPASSNIRERDLATLSQAARANRLANKTRGHQIRERWSDVDTDHLIDLIADRNLGCSWAAMEKEGGFQTSRSQQAIRDKARNLKKAYLCADAILPSGFDYVYLGKKERYDVIASGHNPDRKEDDIDERGHVIRNLWRERLS